MVLADTSVWIDHFRNGHPRLAARLSEGLILMHSFVSGELACGNLKHRPNILSDLHALLRRIRRPTAKSCGLSKIGG
jgi:predicted nucleic acid-binding protein